MKALYIEANMGAAGDMLTAAVAELFDDRDKVIEELNSIGLPDTVFTLEDSVKCGIRGSHMKVTVKGAVEEAHDEHHHEEEHHHHHHSHHGMSDIRNIVGSLRMDKEIKDKVLDIYSVIAEAESHVHGVPVEEIHFHEVGAMDAIADITAFCYLMNRLGCKEVIVSPVNTGNGFCRTMHGILPVPAPATARILEGMPSYDDGTRGELCTPTGAALLKCFASSYGPRPLMRIIKTGTGMGKKDFDKANCVRAMLGETGSSSDVVIEMEANIDDMTAEDISYAVEMLMASGALDAWTQPVMMKKGRPGTKISALVSPADEMSIAEVFFRHTSTIGIRRCAKTRYVLNRVSSEEDTQYGKIRAKRAEGYGSEKTKYEFEDLKRIAMERNISLYEIRKNLGI